MPKGDKKRIFLDYASITPIDPKVLREIDRVSKKYWGNPSSIHSFGEEAKSALEDARFRIAKFLHAKASEVYFTSGGTEGLNLAIFGVINFVEKKNIFPHIILSTIEHPAILEPVKYLLNNKRVEVSFVSPDESGIIRPESIKKELKENTVLVIVQHANNEIGTIQPIRKIKEVIHDFNPSSIDNFKIDNSNKVCLLVDASQSVLYEDVSVERLGADILVFDGIKMYGPRGIGVLFIRKGSQFEPTLFGGGQENKIRPGTENVPAVLGLALATDIITKNREKESRRLSVLRDYFFEKVLKEFDNISINGDPKVRLPNNINVCLGAPKPLAKVGLSKIDSEFLVIKLDTLGFAVSTASACHNLALENSSYVIENIGKPECKNSSIRITMGRETKKSDLDKLFSALKKILKK